jgi:hypothetical protein
MNINQILRFDCPFKALDEAKRSLKAKGFGERHILQTEKGLYRVINPRTQHQQILHGCSQTLSSTQVMI